MWKDFLNFNKRERFTLVVLTLLILVVQVLLWTKDSWVGFLPAEMEQKFQDRKALEAYRDSMVAMKPNRPRAKSLNQNARLEDPVVRIPFNPNTADSTTLRRLGLRAYVVKNILQYRRKGGSFRKPSDLARMYGLDPALFAELEPLIQLETPANSAPHGAPISTEQSVHEEANAIASPSESVPGANSMPDAGQKSAFDLNAADTTMLQQLKGVGSYTANRIERYRNQLGGFYSLSQLAEIKGIYPETLSRLQAMTTIDPGRIRRLDVNKASLEKLRAHPYLTFYQAKVLIELRKARGKITGLEELKDFKEFTSVDLDRLKWYLTFQ